MKYCKSCHVHYDTTLDHCMLCNGELENVENSTESTYKFTEIKKRPASRFFYRFFFFINVVSALICLYLDFAANGWNLTWSLVVAITNFYAIVMFIILAVPTIWTSKLTKSIIATVLAAFLFGLSIKDYFWAIDYVFPIAVGTNIFLITLLIITNKKRWFDYFSSLFIITVIGLIPGLLNLLKVTHESLPSFICFSYALFTLLGIFFLPSKSSREEFKRRFHV